MKYLAIIMVLVVPIARTPKSKQHGSETAKKWQALTAFRSARRRALRELEGFLLDRESQPWTRAKSGTGADGPPGCDSPIWPEWERRPDHRPFVQEAASERDNDESRIRLLLTRKGVGSLLARAGIIYNRKTAFLIIHGSVPKLVDRERLVKSALSLDDPPVRHVGTAMLQVEECT